MNRILIATTALAVACTFAITDADAAGRNKTRNVDRTGQGAQRSSATQWNGPHSSGSSQGSFTRDGNGHYSGGRTTTATGTQGGTYDAQTHYDQNGGQRNVDAVGKNGYRYEGDTTWKKGESASHTSTCYDPQGQVIPCKR